MLTGLKAFKGAEIFHWLIRTNGSIYNWKFSEGIEQGIISRNRGNSQVFLKFFNQAFSGRN